MNILVLGGNRFFGIHLVESLLARGHDVTLLNRGLSGDPTASACNASIATAAIRRPWPASCTAGNMTGFTTTSPTVPRM